MPRRQSNFGFRGRGAPRRQTVWFSSADETSFTVVAAGAVDLQSSLNAAALALRPFTITRVRGILSVRSDQIAADEDVFGAAGLAVVSDQAVAAGVASVPSPITEESSDLWFAFEFAAEGATTLIGNPTTTRTFESKAMRKVEDGMDIVAVFENGGSFGMEYLLKYRMLVKLH